MNIPIYRAKKIDSDNYVEGSLIYFNKNEFAMSFIAPMDVCEKHEKVDKSTLAIHFPDMIDSEGNKIFASLSEDGKGGSELEYESRKYVAYYLNFEIVMSNTTGYHDFTQNLDNEKCKVVGIQK